MDMIFSEWCKALQARDNGPQIFRTHMLNSERISHEEFIKHCSVEAILDEGETFQDYLEYNENVECFRVNLAESPSYILAHAGFEAFFTPNGAKLSYFNEPGNQLMNEQMWGEGLAKVLAPANSAAGLNNGLERDKGMISQHVQHLEGDHDRYLLHIKGNIVAGMLVKDNTVDTLYVCKGSRREGYASALFKAVKNLHPDLQHSESLTNDGKAFSRNVSVGPSF
ncbi:hypothetical protein RYA05_01655 [Pseudomonas syringae pv. actinidiae]|nr:hypothetical protein [Pseudomonas syringae pv. actinidiae]